MFPKSEGAKNIPSSRTIWSVAQLESWAEKDFFQKEEPNNYRPSTATQDIESSECSRKEGSGEAEATRRGI